MTKIFLSTALMNLLFLLSICSCFSQDYEEKCGEISRSDFSSVKDAPTQILYSSLERIKKDGVKYCRVAGYVSTNVGFEILMPSDKWNGKLVKIGCGAYCGSIYSDLSCKYPLLKGYACVVSDMGHKSSVQDGKWAYNNLQAEIDYGFRATHVSILSAKAIVSEYYSKEPRRSYFMGCSTGGRQGLVAAQNFPWDFDGIVAGAPAINLTGVIMNMSWAYLSNLSKDGSPVLDDEDLRFVNSYVLKKCDYSDGVKDGVVGDPRRCGFDPVELACKGNVYFGCLDKNKILALKKIYAGPTTSDGVSIYTGGYAKGSELAWIKELEVTRENTLFRSEMFRYMAFVPDPGPDWELKNFDFDRDYKRLGMMESIYGGTNPDLRKFKSAGGKLIVYQGWNDPQIQPNNIVDYFETVEKTMGGRDSTQEFIRLFMVPGMEHCMGGKGVATFDWLSYLDEWVEHGIAPSAVIGSHVDEVNEWEAVQLPVDPQKVKFTRPIYPYPTLTKYKGAGDPNDAASFGGY